MPSRCIPIPNFRILDATLIHSNSVFDKVLFIVSMNESIGVGSLKYKYFE